MSLNSVASGMMEGNGSLISVMALTSETLGEGDGFWVQAMSHLSVQRKRLWR